MTTPQVVAGWGLGLSILVAIHVGYQRSLFALALFAAVSVLVEVVALAVYLTRPRDGAVGPSPAPRRSTQSLLVAAIVLFVGIGLVWRTYMIIPAFYPALLLAVELGRTLRSRLSPDRWDDVPPRTDDAATRPTGTATTAVAAGAVVGGVAAGARRWWRRR